MEALIGSWRIARGLGRKLIFFWPQPYGYQDEDYSAHSIFDLRAMARSSASDDLRLAERRTGMRKHDLQLDAQRGWPDALDRRKLMAHRSHIFIRSMHTMEFKGENPPDIEQERRQLFHLLLPHPVIRENLQRALDWIGDDAFTAVHIRRGDIVKKLGEAIIYYKRQLAPHASSASDRTDAEKELALHIGNFVPRAASLEAYVEAVKRTERAPRLLVFSDSDDVAKEFQEALADHDVMRFSSFPAELSNLQRAWLEVLVLMRAKQIISTESTFGIFASRYSGVPFINVCPMSATRQIHNFFLSYYEALLKDSPALKKKCLQLINASLRHERLKLRWMAYRRWYKRTWFSLFGKK